MKEHELILTIVNRGFTSQVMDAARGAGATGGTVLHALGTAPKEASRFFGVTILPEKELVLIIAPLEIRSAIMQAIARGAGTSTQAGGITFSLPVSAVRGLPGADAEL